MRGISMMIFGLTLVLLAGCASTAPKTHIARFHPSLLLPKPCKAEAKPVMGIWYVNVTRDFQSSNDSAKYADGAFDARITVWVTFANGQQLVTVTIGASEDGTRVETGTVSTGQMITGEKIVSVDNPTKCEAFAPASA
jgi:hypothetical protein